MAHDMHAAVESMQAAGSGCITASLSLTCAGYGASKAGVIALTKVAACELAPYHIRCNAVAPGEPQLGTFAALHEPQLGTFAGLHFAQGRHSGLSLQIRLCFSFNFVCLRATCCLPTVSNLQATLRPPCLRRPSWEI